MNVLSRIDRRLVAESLNVPAIKKYPATDITGVNQGAVASLLAQHKAGANNAKN